MVFPHATEAWDSIMGSTEMRSYLVPMKGLAKRFLDRSNHCWSMGGNLSVVVMWSTPSGIKGLASFILGA